MAIYESMLVFSGRLEAHEVDQEIDKVKGLIESGGGTLHGVDRMGRRRLAYDIRKEQDGYYAVLYFEGTPDRIAPLQRAFRLNESVLRHIVFRKEKLPEIPPQREVEEGDRAAAPPEGESRPPEPAAEEAAHESSEPRGSAGESEPAEREAPSEPAPGEEEERKSGGAEEEETGGEEPEAGEPEVEETESEEKER